MQLIITGVNSGRNRLVLLLLQPEGSAPERRYVLRDNRFSVHHLNGETEKQTLETADEIREVLETRFLLSLPEENGLDKKLSQLIEDKNKLISQRYS